MCKNGQLLPTKGQIPPIPSSGPNSSSKRYFITVLKEKKMENLSPRIVHSRASHHMIREVGFLELRILFLRYTVHIGVLSKTTDVGLFFISKLDCNLLFIRNSLEKRIVLLISNHCVPSVFNEERLEN